MEYNILCYFRQVSNCAKATEDQGDNEQEDEEGAAAADGDEVITPSDSLIAQELADGPQETEESSATSSVKDAVKAVRTGVHLQETKKPRMTPAACQREALTNTMISFIEKAKSNQEEEADDELDLTFAGIAKHMHLHLNASQRQRVLNKIQTLVSNCIDNVLEGLPLMGAPQMGMQQAQNIMPSPPQPLQNVVPNQVPNAAASEHMSFFEQAVQGIQFDSSGLSFQDL